MSNAYVAVDIGASSGRLMLARIVDGKMLLSEIHRFKNGFAKQAGFERWDIDYLLAEIFEGLRKVKEQGFKKVTLGIDTWAVDYVLVDEQGQKLTDPISYRDARTNGAIARFIQKIGAQAIYQKTGIQFQDFNTLYQLYCEEQSTLQKAAKIMLIPDYLGYALTGKCVTEKTNASTMQLLNLKTKSFDQELLSNINITHEKFDKLTEAGTYLGELKEELRLKYDLPAVSVITVATHDTASAVVGTPGLGDGWAFLSSGTWSLLGVELADPIATNHAYEQNYTNEWGAYQTYRFLKNIMGMWICQCVQRELGEKYSFSQLAAMAKEVQPFQQFIDINDQRFTNPVSMIAELQNYCQETKQVVPKTPGEIFMAIYSNLALFYAYQLEELQQLTDKKITVLNIVGGGSNVALLNQLTSDIAQIKVVAGPSEATAIGNVIVQMIAQNAVSDLATARRLILDSFAIESFVPKEKYADVLVKYKGFLNGGY